MKVKKTKLVFIMAVATMMLVTAACGSGNSGTKGNSSAAPSASNTGSTNKGDSGKTDDNGMPEYMGHHAEKGASLTIYVDVGSKKFVEAVQSEFEAKTGVKIARVEEVSGNDLSKRVNLEGPAGTGPDVFELVNSQEEWISTTALPNDIFHDQTMNTMLPNTLSPVSWNGTLYGYPTSLETYIMYYNKDLMPEAPKTWDQIKEFAKTFNDPKNNKYAFIPPFYEGYLGFTFLAGMGGYVFGDNGTDLLDIGLNNEGAIAGMKYMQSLKEYVPFNSTDMNRDIQDSLFKEGKTAMIIDGPWNMDKFVGPSTGYVTLPAFPGDNKPASFNGIKALYVSQYTKYPIASKMFSFFYSNDENALEFYRMTKNPPANLAAINSQEIQNDPVTKVFIDQFKQGIAQTGAEEFGAWWKVANPIFIQIWDNNADVKKTLDDSVAQMKEIIAELPKNKGKTIPYK